MSVPTGYRLDWSGAFVREPQVYVYIVQEEGGGLVKIGRTADLSTRIKTLESVIPRPLVILAVLRGDADLELDLHYRFVYSRERGEWFRPTRDILDFAADNYDVEVVLEALSPDEREAVIWPT